MDIEKRLKKLSHRYWPELRDAWLAHIPTVHDFSAPPENAIDENEALVEALGRCDKSSIDEITVPSLREDSLREAVFLSFKGLHVGVRAIEQVRRGAWTWAQVSSYQSAYFHVRALLLLLGIHVLTCKYGTFVIDLWHQPIKKKRNKGISSVAIPDVYGALYLGTKQFAHYEVWEVLRRTVRTTTQPVWSHWFSDLLKEINGREYARQRNHIIYRSNCWLFDDLLLLDADSNHRITLDIPDMPSQTLEEELGSVYLMTGFCREAWSVIRDIADYSGPVAAALELRDRDLDSRLISTWEGNFSII